ncbi:ABC transporter substrate-binding protein (plasmid) [Rhodococcus sp. BH4]|uniref:ABC transporter substrate-binding protein n=1 Tax=Rhodococcus sp. BH4 TaxID=1807790 RepID=UPI0009C2B816|nr:ABC transporter substrate-binding protein [Rhodococcus sp. BH4]ARE37811.1 ABC transporter substrate-binding protein [Rhodococcus sp. BH4]
MTFSRSTPRTFRRSRLAAVALMAVVPVIGLGTACSSDSTDTASSDSVEAPSSAFPDKPATGTPIKIGLINPEGGPAVSQPGNREAAEAVVKYANANLGGIAGHPITMVSCKNQEDPASARDCANQMVEQGVAAVIVPTTSNGEAMVPIVTGAGIPIMSVSGSGPAELTTPNSFVLTGGFPGTLKSMAAHSKANNFKKVTAFVTDNGSVVAGTKAMGEPAFKAAGVELQIVPIPKGTPDATPQVSSGLSGTDAVAIVGDATMCTSVLKAFSTVGADQKRMIIQPCIDPSTIEAAGDAVEGSLLFTTSDTQSNDPEAVLYRSVMKKYSPSTDIGGYTVVGYQSMLSLIRATEGLTGEPTPAAVITALKAAKDVPLPAGHGMTFTCDGTAVTGMPAVCSSGTMTATVEDGKPVDPQLVK